MSDEKQTQPEMTLAAAKVELTFYRRMMQLVAEGGWLVSSSRCSAQELAWARAEGRMFVDQDGLGYVVRPAASFPEQQT